MEENNGYPSQDTERDTNQASETEHSGYTQDVESAEAGKAGDVTAGAGVEGQENAFGGGDRAEYGWQGGLNRNDPYQPQAFQDNGYQNHTYQNNVYQNHTYQDNVYQDNVHQDSTYQNHAYQNYQPYQNYNGNYQPYPNERMELEEPVRISEWVLSLVLMMIPCVNIIMMFVWAFSNTEKKSKSNFFKAYLIFFGISMGVMLLIWIAVVFFALVL